MIGSVLFEHCYAKHCGFTLWHRCFKFLPAFLMYKQYNTFAVVISPTRMSLNQNESCRARLAHPNCEDLVFQCIQNRPKLDEKCSSRLPLF